MRRVAFGPIALALALAFPGLQATAASPDDDRGPVFVEHEAPIVVETVDPALDPSEFEEEVEAVRAAMETEALTAGTAVPFRRGGLNGGIRPSFAADVPPNVRSVVASAVAQWDAALVTNVPIVVQVGWACFGNPGLLGFAGPATLHTSTALPTADQYPAALANTLAGFDVNGAQPEIVMALNAELSSTNTCNYATGEWYISTGASVGAGQIDLYSVALHELAHGLGFLGSAWQEGPSPALESPRYVYDTKVHAGATRLVEMANPNGQLTSGNLFYDLGGGHRWRVYAPSSFLNGSSFSHFDFSLSGQPGALMTPALGDGVIHRSLDAPVLAVLSQQGWNVVPRAVTPVGLRVTTASGQATVSWSHNLGAYGLPPLSYRVDIRIGGTTVASTTVAGTATTATLGGLANNANYAAVVTPNDARGPAAGAQACFYLAHAPSAPQMVRSEGVGLARTVAWAPPQHLGVGGAITYTVQYRVIGTSNWVGVGSTSGLSIATPVLAKAAHQFRVAASNSAGLGPWGNSTIVGVSDSHLRPLPLDGQIGRLYSAYLRRLPEKAGFDFWMGQRAGGRPLSDVSAAFSTIPEFQASYGTLSNEAFVDLVYRNVVGRAPDPVGRAFWIDYLRRGNSRGALMIGFSESAEYVARTGTAPPTTANVARMNRLYLAFFQREPDPAGLAFWVGRLDAGSALGPVANNFAASIEFQTVYGCLQDAQFVQLVYRNVLSRDPDAGGLGYWTGRLAAGLARGDLMIGFSESPEYVLRTGSIR